MKNESPTSKRDDRSAGNISLYGSGRADSRPAVATVGAISQATNYVANVSPSGHGDRADRESISGAGARWTAGLRALRYGVTPLTSNTDGSDEHELLPPDVEGPRWSPDGTKLSVVASNSQRLIFAGTVDPGRVGLCAVRES